MTIKGINRLTYLGLMLASGSALFAQTTTGGFTGKVTDPKGVPVAGVTVRAKSPSLNLPVETRTDAKGIWHLGLLPPGNYKVTFSKDGFYGRSADQYLGVSKTEAINLALKPIDAVASATVEVVDAIQTITAKTEVKTATNFQGEQLLELPGRTSFTDLLKYSPGTDSSGLVRGADPKKGISMAIDGVDTRDDMSYANSATSVSMVTPIYDSIQDIQVVQNAVNARNGRSLGPQYIMVTKRGGNEFSGSLRAYYGRTSWVSDTSNNSSNLSEKGDNLTTAQWSFTFSGPILKDRLTFFLSGLTSPTIQSQTSLFSWDETYGSVSSLGPLHTGNTSTDTVLQAGPGSGYTTGISTTAQMVGQRKTDKQWDLRLSGTISANHNLDLKFSNRERALSNAVDSTAIAYLMESASLLGSYRQKNNSYSVVYTGTLSSSTTLEATLSQGRYEVGADCNSVDGATVPVLAAQESNSETAKAYGAQYYPTLLQYFTDGLTESSLANSDASYLNLMSSVVSPTKEKHQTNTINVNLKTFIDWHGEHEIDLGLEGYQMTYNPGNLIGKSNKVVYAGGWFKNGSDWLFPTVNWEGLNVNGQNFGALGPAPVMLEAWAKATDSKNKSMALWLNDQWVISDRINMSAGVRWNRYQITEGTGRTLGKSISLEPRFLVRWDPKGNGEHLFTLSFTRNAQGFSSTVAASLATSPMNCYTLRGWKGVGSQPNISSLGSSTDGGQYGVRFVDYATLTDSSNYASTPYYFVNKAVTTRVKGMRAPYADQWELNYTHNLSDGTSVRVALVDKRFRAELLTWTDYTWDNLALSVDPSGMSGGTPKWLQVTNYGSTHKARVYQSAEISIDNKLTSRLAWNLAWSYIYTYNYDEQGRLNYAAVKASSVNTLPSSYYLADGVTKRAHRVSSILTYSQPLGKGSVRYTLTGIYEPVNPTYLASTYYVRAYPSTFVNAADTVNNPNGYAVSVSSSYPTLKAYYATPGNWKSGIDSFTVGLNIAWDVPVYRKVTFVGNIGVSDLLHKVDHGGGYGSTCPTSSTVTKMPNGRILGSFTGNGVSTGSGWGTAGSYPYYAGMTSSTRPVTNVSAGFRF